MKDLFAVAGYVVVFLLAAWGMLDLLLKFF